ncbi:MAG: S-formylglutathione hydrolase [Pseudomonadota bacterium]
MEHLSTHLCFGGEQQQFRHQSAVLDCEMTFSLYLPPKARDEAVPLMIWLSGLTCTDQNFVTKAGAQQHAAEHGIAILCPDTSPRGSGVPDDPEGAWDFGQGAGFYVNATEPPWSTHYHMYDYVLQELRALACDSFPIDRNRMSIAGHSMGGHGALVMALRNPGIFTCVSAFSPIVSPTNCPWGQKALTAYLGPHQQDWAAYDSCELVSRADQVVPMLIDQGDADEFLRSQLKVPLLVEAARLANYPLQLRMQPGYDHSYFFISTFIGDHIAFHAQHLI